MSCPNMEINKKKLALALLLEDETSSDSDDGDYEELKVLNKLLDREKLAKIPNYVENVVELMPRKQFKKTFRMTRTTVEKVQDLFIKSDFFKTQTGGGRRQIPASHYAYIFLEFVGNKTSYRQLSVLYNVAESKAHKIINTFADFLVSKASTFIKFPKTGAEKEKCALEFFKISSFPDVIGCLDGSYIRVRAPANRLKEAYINRHDDVSITLQAICDANLKFLDVFTGAPSRIHDSRVLKLSPISSQLQNLCEGKYHILADAAYPLREWIMTPYKKYGEFTRAQTEFNGHLCPSRVKIENAFGVLKRRFLQLLQLFSFSVDAMTKIIISCCVLHNICVDEGDLVEDDWDLEEEHCSEAENEDLESNADERSNILKRLGEMKRDRIANSFFQ